MTGGEGDRPGVSVPSGADGDRLFSRANLIEIAKDPAMPADETSIGRDMVALLDKELVLSVDPDLQVRVRIYAPDRRTILIDVATTAQRALHIAGLFKRAAERADASLIVLPPPVAP